MKNKKDDDLTFFIGFCAVVAFVIFAAVFIVWQIGFQGLAIGMLTLLIFVPLLLVPSLKSSRRTRAQKKDPFLDPVYKGMSGNIFTKKD